VLFKFKSLKEFVDQGWPDLVKFRGTSILVLVVEDDTRSMDEKFEKTKDSSDRCHQHFSLL
jgi:hypothetical protein